MPTAGAYGSPTESEFSEHDPSESVKNWDEDKVCEYLRSVKCGEYEKIFRKNHINGENLLEMDKEVLKEMGVEKVGDRVRLFLSIKKLRTRAYANEKKRNRVGYSSNCCLCGTRGLTYLRTPLVASTFTLPLLVARPGHQTHPEWCPRQPPTRDSQDRLTSMVAWIVA